MNALEKLRETVDAIRGSSDPDGVTSAWGLAGRLLGRMPVDHGEVDRIVEARDASALDALVTRLEAPPAPEAAPKPKPDGDGKAFSTEDMAAAMRAFKKRLKLARLAEESKLGGRYVSGGKTSKIDAIIPPNDWGWEMWDALARAGRLVDTGQGFYALPGAERPA